MLFLIPFDFKAEYQYQTFRTIRMHKFLVHIYIIVSNCFNHNLGNESTFSLRLIEEVLNLSHLPC